MCVMARDHHPPLLCTFLAMSLSSFALYNLEVPSVVEASCQNFAAGLILAAGVCDVFNNSRPIANIFIPLIVAAELFPLMVENTTDSDTWIGVTVGFAFGLLVVFGLESVVDALGGQEEEEEEKEKAIEHPASKSTSASNTSTTNAALLEGYVATVDGQGEWEEEGVKRGVTSIALSSHRGLINIQLQDIIDFISTMTVKCKDLLDPKFSQGDQEDIVEKVDESTHILEYKIDRAKRCSCLVLAGLQLT